MPYSSHSGLSAALEHAIRLRPRRVLDVGAGFGKWGYLLREALDFIDGRVDRAEWSVRIDGIDALAQDSPILAWVYDDVRVADIRDAVDGLSGYDLVVLGDVIEHFDKDEGLRILGSLLARNRNVLLTTPLDYFEQEVEGNEFERHRSHWTIEDFRPWPFEYEVAGGFLQVVVLGGAGAQWPRAGDSRASRLVYRFGLLRRRGAAARVAKALARPIVAFHREPVELHAGLAAPRTWSGALARVSVAGPNALVARLAWYPRRLRDATRAKRRLRREVAGMDLDAAVDYAWSFEWEAGTLRPRQSRVELDRLLRLLADERPRVVVEIGTLYGATLFMWSRVAADDALLVGLDLTDQVARALSPRAAFCRGFARERQRVRTLFGRDSARPETRAKLERMLGGRQIDFLFIDGDHTYEGVARDFETYVDLVRPGGLVAFHDIAHEVVPGIETAAFWRDFKAEHETEEIVEGGPEPMGIGLYRVPGAPLSG